MLILKKYRKTNVALRAACSSNGKEHIGRPLHVHTLMHSSWLGLCAQGCLGREGLVRPSQSPKRGGPISGSLMLPRALSCSPFDPPMPPLKRSYSLSWTKAVITNPKFGVYRLLLAFWKGSRGEHRGKACGCLKWVLLAFGCSCPCRFPTT